jgi:hypothetical protein
MNQGQQIFAHKTGPECPSVGGSMHSERSRVGGIQDHLFYQHAPTDHTPRDFSGCTLQMGLYMDVGRDVPYGG